MKNTPTSTALKIFTVLICLFGLGVGKMSAATWKIGAAKAGPGGINKILPGEPPVRTWTVTKEADAIEGEILSGTSEGETHPIPVIIPKAGTYRVWVRHYHIDGAYTSFFVLFRNQLGQAVDFHNVDFKLRSIIATAKPILQGEVPSPTPAPTPVTAKPEFVWTSFDVTFEAPMEGTISFGPTMGQTNGKLGIDCVVISDDKSFDPAKVDKAEIAKLGADGGPLQPQTPPTGMQLAPVLTAHTSFFSPSDISQDDKFVFSLINQIPTYRDYAWAVQMGSNSDHGWTNGNSKYGVDTEVSVDGSYVARRELAKETPEPTGRFVSADGKVSKDYFSLSYAPFAEAARAEMTRRLPDFIQDPDAKNIMISSESSGSFDYGPDATKAFHAWLATRFTTIDKLNTLWRTQYKSFDEIPLPLMPEENSKENKAAWFAFREFSGLKYVENIAANATLLRNHPGRKLLPTSQSSCLTINSPTFTSGGPMDFEDLINVGFANEGHFGMDAYSTADSFAGCDIDFLLSLTKGRKFVNNEFNVHSQDPRNMAQTYWAMLSKGTKGVATWQFQESPGLWMYYMWALVHSDDTPRDKLGPIADSNQEIHRLERILGPAKPAAFVKPIALYYSRMDLSLKQTTLGVYSSAFDSPYRIYAILRGLGYPVRWITPKQIEAGELKDVSAVFLVGVAHVPGGAATKLAQWVKDGGCIAGDQWPGGFNEYDYTQTTLLDVFGIRPAFTGKAMDKATAQHALATTTTPVGGGIDPEVLRTLAADQLLKNVEEMWDQFDSKHPVALAAGNWHLSGFDLKKVGVISPTAEVIGMTMSDDRLPGIVINDFGKGHAMYIAMMMGTLFETGPVAFEWDTAREGPGLTHLLKGFLDYSKVQPLSVVDMPERLSWRMRIETPLVDTKGNVFVGLTSLNEAPLATFPMTLVWPVAAPKMAFALTAGSREMKQIPFEVKNGKLSVTMPGFDTAASLLALTNSAPLVSLDITGAPRGVANMLDVTPGTRLKIKATVWNPSAQKLPAGEVKLFTVPGWFCAAGEMKVDAIEAYGHQEVTFEVEAPALFTKASIRPIVFKYSAGKVTSSPCTEMVWWMNKAEKK